MTKDQFLAGVSFKVKGLTYKGAETFRYQEGSIVRESRYIQDEEVLTYNHHCNIDFIGRVGFKGFTFVFNKKININLRFEDLVVFINEK